MCNVLGCNPYCAGLIAHYVKEPMKDIDNKVVCIEEITQSRCLRCGDGGCDKGENWCICPEDYERSRPGDLELYPF